MDFADKATQTLCDLMDGKGGKNWSQRSRALQHFQRILGLDSGGVRVNINNQAAVVDKLFTTLPEIVRAMAAPLANVDRITVVSTGNGDATGMNKITGDLTKMAAQVPALFETLSGMSMSELFAKVRTIGDKGPKPPDALPPSSKGAGVGK